MRLLKKKQYLDNKKIAIRYAQLINRCGDSDAVMHICHHIMDNSIIHKQWLGFIGKIATNRLDVICKNKKHYRPRILNGFDPDTNLYIVGHEGGYELLYSQLNITK